MFITSEVWEAQIQKAKEANKSIEEKYLNKMKGKDVNDRNVYKQLSSSLSYFYRSNECI